MTYFGQFTYSTKAPARDINARLEKRTEPDVTIEAHDGSIGIHVPSDGDELRYFSVTEARMIAHALLALAGEDNE